MADANLKIPSEERIRFNASESIINAVSPRVDISTIPGGHRMRVTDIDGVETADIMDGVKGDTGDAAGFGTVSASVDANVGTPSVTVTSSGPNTAKNFDISFKNLKGVKGDTGDAAGFGTVSASVDANVGTPSVTVTSSGPNTAKNFDISFKNLKGNTGAAAGFDTPTASVDGYIGTPSVAVTATGPNTAKKFNFAFHNLKGEKGDTGSIEDLIVDGTEPEEGAGVSVDGPISELSAEGWATQFSTSGKNLLPNNATSQTVNGVTFTVNADGSMTANGTASSSVWILLNSGFTLSSSGILSGCPAGGGSAKYALALVGSSTIYDFGSGLSVQAGEYSATYVYIATGQPVTNITFYPQLELGSTATEYEPYTGGAPSPSPDYPQEIEVAKGRNLIDESTIQHAYVYDSTGNYVANISYMCSDFIKVHEGTYSIRYYKTRTDSGGAILALFSSDKTYLRRQVLIGGEPSTGYKSTTFSLSSDVSYAKLCIPNNSTSVQFELGSTPLPYVPYGYVGMEVQGKNLAVLEQGTVSMTNGSDENSTTRVRTNYIPIKTGIAYIASTNGWSVRNGIIYDSNKNFIANGVWPNTSTNILIVNNADAAYIRLIYSHIDGSETCSPDDFWYQLELGSTATSYEPYRHTTTPIPLPERGWVGSLPDGTADILHLDGAGKVEWELASTEKVFDGTNPIPSQLPSQTNFRPVFRTADGIANYGRILSSHSVNAYYAGNNGPEFYFSYDKFSDLDSFKTWLSTHPVTVLYPLQTPTTESLGYIDLPDIPAGSTVSIPELDALGISYYIDNGAVRKLVEQYKARLEATSFADIEDAVTELAAEVHENTNRTQLYFGYDTVNGKQMISVFKRNV